jgi:hypothetical protein
MAEAGAKIGRSFAQDKPLCVLFNIDSKTTAPKRSEGHVAVLAEEIGECEIDWMTVTFSLARAAFPVDWYNQSPLRGGRHIMKHVRFQSIPTAFLVVFGILLAGCEAAQVPLGPPDEMTIIKQATGQWVSVSEDADAEPARLHVWAFNDHEYYVEWEMEDDEDDVARIRTFVSDLGDFLFANVQCINC